MNKLVLASVIGVVLTGCGSSDSSSDSPEPPTNCSVANQNQFVYDVLKDTYLWYQDVPDLDPNDFASPEALLERVKQDIPLDRFSYITEAGAFESFFEAGTYIGFGFSSELNQTNDALLLRYVFTQSPAGERNLARGDQIIAVDGVSVSEIVANGDINTVFGDAEEGVTRTLTIVDKNDVQFDVELVKALVTMNTVLASEVIDYQGKKYGYFAFSSFIEPSEAELTAAFNQFVAANVDDIIMDLRYNGGGRVSTASHLSSLIGGNTTLNQVFVSYLHNDKYTHWNDSVEFENLGRAGWDNLYVITSERSCSASEMTINALDPYINVRLVGSTTCGKPVGMYGAEFCGKRIQPIEFQTVNGVGFGDYFDGFAVHCDASDDLTRDFADPQEGMLATALALASSNSCAPAVAGKDSRSDKQLAPFAIAPYNINQ